MHNLFLVLYLFSFVFNKSENTFIIKDFSPFINYSASTDTLQMKMDLTNAITQGIILPSSHETDDKKYFKISFFIKNTTDSARAFHYKIYYQNESYKISEGTVINEYPSYNRSSSNNFYGSWENSNEGFHVTKLIQPDGNFHEVCDSLRIVGNPREEEKYFGSVTVNSKLNIEDVNRTINRIKNSDEWVSQIQKKATENNITLDEQFYHDAIWIIDHDRKKGRENNRWKRNPRTGNYSFLLVVTDENGIKNIPESVQYIGMKDTAIMNYLNPYFYFLYSKIPDNVYIEKSKKILKSKAKMDVAKGIYVDMLKYKGFDYDLSNLTAYCGTTDELFKEAHFEQFFHNINKNFKLRNIPLNYDVVKSNYTARKYYQQMEKANKITISEDNIYITKHPGRTVGFDKKEKAIYIKNPGNKNIDEPIKENVGVNTRIGFTYGKYRAKIKFPVLLSSDNVWNGVTCAFWLLFQDAAEWNNRSNCLGSGYIPKGDDGPSENRSPMTTYSEIDIEIVKTSKYWPQTSYGTPDFPKDEPSLNDELIVACTNWDLSCREPSDFHVGVKTCVHDNQSFDLHRWDDWYKAITLKTADHQKNIVGDLIYYEIEWQPDRIIWRIGISRNDMKVIGYMDSSSTKIPDNQMIAVITQEFHDAKWWPLSPWDQNYIPFPKNDITGYVYDIEIE